MKTRLVGILNVTPDSFSDGGKYTNIDTMLAHVDTMIADGASVIDVGAESTRPGATPLTYEEEWERLRDILPAIRSTFPNATISLDSYRPETMLKSIELGLIDWVNDVSSALPTTILEHIASNNLHLVLMHNLGIPASKDTIIPSDKDPIIEITNWINNKMQNIEKYNISNIIFDPGIGFGKNAEQSIDILLRISELKKLGHPIYVGHSEKSFLSHYTDKPAGERTHETGLVSAYLAQNDVDYIRVHDVKSNMDAIHTGETMW